MKTFKLIFIVTLLTNFLYGQSIILQPDSLPLFQSGKIYVKVTNNSTIELTDSPTLSRGDIQNIFNQFGVINVEKPFVALNTSIFDRTYRITFTDTLNVDSFIINLEAIDVIEYAEKVPMMYPQIIPNDPLQSSNGQQYLNLINANGASNIYQTNPGAIGNSVVAIVDDAVLTTHEDLAANIFTSNRDVADLDNDPNPPLSGVTAANGTRFSHGTHVAGIAGAVTDNNTGVASVGWSNHIMAIKTRANSDGGNVLPFAFDGVVWAIANGAQVINMSWGGAPASQTDYNILVQAQNLGIVLVAAAGNSGMGTAFYPAAYGEGTTGQSWEVLDRTLVIAVAALDNNNDRSIWSGGFGTSGSNFGHWVDIAAYGTGILSSVANASGGNPINNLYDNFNGTSMAAPMVSGVAGIMRGGNPSASTTDIYNCLVYSANPDIYNVTLHPINTQGTLGHGRLDAEAALQCLITSCANNPIAVISPSSTSICPGGNVTLTANQGISYLWSTGATTQNISVSTPGIYSVTVTFVGNCTATASINVSNVNTNLTLNVFENSDVPNDGIICGAGNSNNTFTLCASATGSSYSWNPFGSMGWGQCTGTILFSLSVPASATFTVTVTDMNGCVGLNGTASVTVQAIPPPFTTTVTPSMPQICVGQSVQLTASGANTYTWFPSTGLSSGSGATVTASPTTTTTYTVVGRDLNGCQDDATVTVNPLPTISIARSSATICEGQSVQLTASGANTYVWSPATGLSSTTGTTVTATPTTTTTYTVTGTDVNGCTNTFSATITVIPVAYTHPNGITISPNTPPWTGVNFKINGPVYIEDNATLKIDGGSIIEFGPQGIIRNDQFSTGNIRNITNPLALVVNGATLTGLSGCSDNFWKGINITGEVEITNSIIENAQTGINLHDVFDLGNSSFVVSGRLDIANTTFRNNQRAIVMNSSLNSNPVGRLVVNSGSIFENTTAIPSSFTNQVVFITVSSNSEFRIQNTSFNNNSIFSGINRPIGINYFSPSIGGGTYLIENNTFTDLQEAIIVRNSRIMQIKTNTFTATDRAVLLQGGRLDLVENNNFTVPNATNNDNYGVRLIGTSGADIINNFFTGTSGNPLFDTYGIIAENTGTGGSTVFDNTFEGTDIGIQTQGDNSNLKIRCNTFAADGNPHNIASWTTLIIPGPLGAMNTLRRQGSSCNSTLPQNPNVNENQAGNEWLDNCGVGLTDVVIDPNISFPYYAHERVNATSLETTQPSCSTPFWATNTTPYVDLDVCFGVNKTATSCNNQFAGLIKDPNIDFEGYVIEVRNLMLLLQQQADSLIEVLNEGNASTLFNAIGTLSSGDLKNLLLAASPYLSDEVLITYIFFAPPAGNLQQVIVANSPVSERVQQVLDGTVLPKGIINNINNAQTGTSERTIVEQEISYLNGEVQLLANDLERRFSQNADRPREKQLLIDLNDVEAQKRLSEVLLGEENTTNSKVIIDAMLQDTAVSSVDENLHFCNLMTCLINAADQNRTLQQLTPSEMQTVATVAASPTQIAEKAQGVLTAIAQQNFVHPIAKIQTGNNLREGETTLEQEDVILDDINEITLYPNPSTGFITLNYNQQKNNNLSIEVYNVLGEKVYAALLTSSTINLNALHNGIYLIKVLNHSGVPVSSHRLIIQK